METYEDPMIQIDSFATVDTVGHSHTSKVPIHSGDISDGDEL